MRKIAIVGAGFSGLALAYFLQGWGEVTLFDGELEGAASPVAHGLCHPFVGKRALLNFRAEEGMRESRALFDLAEEALEEPIYEAKGIVRFALGSEQERDFKAAAEEYDGLSWFPKEESPLEGVPHPGILIKEGIVVQAKRYIAGLKKLVGADLVKRRVNRGELREFDLVLFATGAESSKLFKEEPFQLIKGQILKFKGTLPLAVMSKRYLAESGGVLSLGATYERNFLDSSVDLELAKQELLPEGELLYPKLKGMEILGAEAGVRCFTKDKRPLFKQVGEREWLFTAMGSKGLLYHALLAKESISQLMSRY